MHVTTGFPAPTLPSRTSSSAPSAAFDSAVAENSAISEKVFGFLFLKKVFVVAKNYFWPVLPFLRSIGRLRRRLPISLRFLKSFENFCVFSVFEKSAKMKKLWKSLIVLLACFWFWCFFVRRFRCALRALFSKNFLWILNPFAGPFESIIYFSEIIFLVFSKKFISEKNIQFLQKCTFFSILFETGTKWTSTFFSEQKYFFRNLFFENIFYFWKLFF